VLATQELLDPEGWAEILELYARSVNIAVALVDHESRLIGRCHNPSPVWSQARMARPEWGDGCVFCLEGSDHCTASADAERTESMVMARDLGGYVHVAAPLFIDQQHLGTLLAGQVFDHYPDMLLLERVAREFRLSGQELWDLARQHVPISRATLTIYGKLLGTLGNAYLRERNATILQRTLASTNQQLLRSNKNLEDKVGELAQSVAEKDILLNEVHHRVNNNLAVIGSLLRMQAEAFPDNRVADALKTSQLRLEAMAVIHAQLYNSVDWRAVNFAEYATVLVENLFRAYGVDSSRVSFRVAIENVELSVDKAIPAGLILNELISNALKHAFPDGRQGTIFIRGRCHDGRVELSVQDDGAGIREPSEPRRNKSLGLKIVDILYRQLKGTFAGPGAADPGPGCTFRLSFPQTLPTVSAASR